MTESPIYKKMQTLRLSERFQTLLWRAGEAVQNRESSDYPGELTALGFSPGVSLVALCFSLLGSYWCIFNIKECA